MRRRRVPFALIVLTGCLVLLSLALAPTYAQELSAARIDQLVQELKSHNAAKNALAADRLGRMGTAARPAIPDLLLALKDPDWNLRHHATSALVLVGTPASIAFPALLEVLKDPNADVRQNAAEAISTMALSIQDQADQMSPPRLNRMVQRMEALQQALNAGVAGGTLKAEELREAPRNVARAIKEMKVQQQPRDGEATPLPPDSPSQRLALWAFHHKAVAGAATYLLVVVGLNGLLLAGRPIALLYLNNGLTKAVDIRLPAPLNGLKRVPGLVCGAALFHYHPRVLDAWVKKYAAQARKHLDARCTFQDRRVYVNVPIDFPSGSKPPAPADFQAIFGGNSAVVLLWGDADSGKTTLVCQLARWALADKAQERLCKTHRMMPVFLEENLPGAKPGDSTALLEAIANSLTQLTEEKAAPAPNFVKRLLARRRVLLIVDGYSELNAEMQQVISPNAPDLLINALLVTSRDKDSLKNANPLALRTSLLKEPDGTHCS